MPKIQLAAVIALALLSNYHDARAQVISEADKPRVLAALSIASFDTLAERCAREGGFDAEQRAEVERWVSANQVDRLRAHLQGAGLSPTLRGQVRQGAAQVLAQVPTNLGYCKAAVIMTRTSGAQFADKLPELLANAPTALAGNAAPVPTARPGTGPIAGKGAQLAREIEGFGFDSCTRVGYGGMVMFAPCPVVLFKNGTALKDVEALNQPEGLAAMRATMPDKWTQWRRQGERVQVIKKGHWENITYSAVYSALPEGFSLDGRFQSLGGGGNTAMGGGQAVMVWSDYVFTPDGRVQRDGGASSSTTGGGVDVTTSGTRAAKRGRYRIDGLILAIDYDDGSSERRVIIADPKDGGKGTMWLDGEGYSVRKGN